MSTLVVPRRHHLEFRPPPEMIPSLSVVEDSRDQQSLLQTHQGKDSYLEAPVIVFLATVLIFQCSMKAPESLP